MERIHIADEPNIQRLPFRRPPRRQRLMDHTGPRSDPPMPMLMTCVNRPPEAVQYSHSDCIGEGEERPRGHDVFHDRLSRHLETVFHSPLKAIAGRHAPLFR